MFSLVFSYIFYHIWKCKKIGSKAEMANIGDNFLYAYIVKKLANLTLILNMNPFGGPIQIFPYNFWPKSLWGPSWNPLGYLYTKFKP